MAHISNISPFSRNSIVAALGVIAGLLWTQVSGELMNMLAPNGVLGIPYIRSILASLSDIIVLTSAICFTAGIGLGKIGKLSGLSAPAIRPFVVYGTMFGAVGMICTYLAPVAEDLSIADLFWLGVGGPISEEIIYRGLAIGALMTIAGWRFPPAALAPAIVFGLAHITQGNALADSLGIAAITGFGGLLFGWMFFRWGFNLWPAILAHIGLNTLWVVFALGETALGDWFGNALRILLVVLLVLSSIKLAPLAGSHNNT